MESGRQDDERFSWRQLIGPRLAGLLRWQRMAGSGPCNDICAYYSEIESQLVDLSQKRLRIANFLGIPGLETGSTSEGLANLGGIQQTIIIQNLRSATAGSNRDNLGSTTDVLDFPGGLKRDSPEYPKKR